MGSVSDGQRKGNDDGTVGTQNMQMMLIVLRLY